MKKSILFLLFSCAFLIHSFAQTKKIALASHSGKKSEFRIDGDGNFGTNPILEAQMRYYYDSVRVVDSLNFIRQKNQIPPVHFSDSVRKADSIRFHKTLNAPPKKQGRKAKGVHAAAFLLKPKNTMAVK
jgi:hypothetical protein